MVKVELLYFEGCPGYEQLLPRLRELVAEAGVAERVQLRPVEAAAEAVAERFLGSPTVRVDGADVEPGADRRSDFGLKCRLYSTPDGLRRTPFEEWMVDALSTKKGERDANSGDAG